MTTLVIALDGEGSYTHVAVMEITFTAFRVVGPGVTGYFGTGRIGAIPIYPGPSGRIFRNHSD